MKIKRQNGWIRLLNEDNSFVEAICFDFPKRDMRQLVKEHIEEQERYIKRLNLRLDLIKKAYNENYH